MSMSYELTKSLTIMVLGFALILVPTTAMAEDKKTCKEKCQEEVQACNDACGPDDMDCFTKCASAAKECLKKCKKQ